MIVQKMYIQTRERNKLTSSWSQ